MCLVTIVSRMGASGRDSRTFLTPPISEKGAERMARTNHWGATAAAAGTLVAAGLLLLIMLVVVEARPAKATFPGKNGKIAFVRYGVLDSHIFTINPDGSGLFKISTRLIFDSDPAWSPDGKKIAFLGSTYVGLLRGNYDIYVVNADGSRPKRITESQTSDFNPSWSPDGKTIAFFRQSRRSCIYKIRVDGTGLKELTCTKRVASDPDWSPNGKEIAYRGTDGHDDEIYTINVSGGTPFNVTNNNDVFGGDSTPSYSPDGKKIAYLSYDGHDSEIYTINAKGGTPVQVTYDHTDAWGPDWGSRP